MEKSLESQGSRDFSMSLLWGENIISGLPFGLGRGTISTVAAHMRQDAAHSVVLPAKRLLLMLHHSKNQQS